MLKNYIKVKKVEQIEYKIEDCMEKKQKKHKSVQYDNWGYFFIAPFFLIYFIFSFIPLITTFTNSFAEDYMIGINEEGPHYVVPKYFSGEKRDYAKQMSNVESKLEQLKSQYSSNDAVNQALKDSINDILENTAYNLEKEKYSAALEKRLQKNINSNALEYIEIVSEVVLDKEIALKKNFRTLFDKKDNLGRYFLNTLIMWIMGFVPQILISLMLAVWFTNTELRLKAQQFFKTVIYMPNLIMAATFAMLFFNLFAPTGPINSLIRNFVDKTNVPDLSKQISETIAALNAYATEHASDQSLVNTISMIVSSMQDKISTLASKYTLAQANEILISLKNAASGIFNSNYKGIDSLNVMYIISDGLAVHNLPMEPIRFFNSAGWTRTLVALMNFLMWYGNTTILLMAGVMGIDNSLFEAARIDGASPLQIFFKVTIPLLLPIFVYVLITSLIGGIQMFDVPQILTNGSGSPDRTVMTIIMKLNKHLQNKNYGPAGATSILIFAITGILSAIVYKTTMQKYQNKR